MSSIAPALMEVVGSTGVCSWEEMNAELQSQLQQAHHPDAPCVCMVYPPTQSKLAEVLACAHQNQWTVIPSGRGSKLHWGGLATSAQIGLSTARLDRLIDHAVGDLTVTAEAGMRLSTLQQVLAQSGQFLPVDPSYPQEATLGGIVATADTGSLRHRYGGIRDLLIGLSFGRADGKVSKAGGRVVKNVAGYDLMKLMTGSYGTLGVITQVTFRIYPLPPAAQTVVFVGESESIAQATATLLASSLAPTAVDLLAPHTSQALNLGESFALMVRFQSMEVSVQTQVEQMRQMAQALGLQQICFSETGDALLWQRLQEKMDIPPTLAPITCKIGVEPAQAAFVLAQLHRLTEGQVSGRIHAASGLGQVQFSTLTPPQLQQMRSLCESQGGFLTVLAAPLSLKQAIDVWGYSGNALDVMQALKRQFDPHQLLSRHRFVGGI